ncbi:MAG: hypothetical protein WC119_02180 [Synergistaceae bacterium]
MKRSFIRALWGIYEHKERRMYKRRTIQDNNMRILKKNKMAQPFVCYTFGEDNHKFLEDQGFNSVMIDKRPIVWDMDTKQFRHKLEVLKCGLQEFDEIIFLDWDCMAIRPLPNDMWDKLYEKEPIQAILRMYHRKKAIWRKNETRQIPEASWVYVRGAKIGDDLINAWHDMGEPWSEEIVIAKYIDDRMGGWNRDCYWEKYEPYIYTWANTRVCSPSLISQPPIFAHIAPNKVARICTRLNKSNRSSDAIIRDFCNANKNVNSI